MSYLRHDKIFRTLRIRGTLETKSRLHIGSGEYSENSFEESDSLLIRINKEGLEVPYIPGSSMKGIFRSTIEALLNFYGIGACCFEEKSSCKTVGKRIANKNYSNNIEEFNKLLSQYCLACQIFGGHGYASNVFISECIPKSSSDVKFDIAPGIAINRRDATAMRGALFTYEFIYPNSKFNFQMDINNLPNFLIGLLFYVIYFINIEVILIGGKKRAGLGSANIIIEDLHFRTPQNNIFNENSLRISYPKINQIDGGEIKIEELKAGIKDYDVVIPLNLLRNKSKEDFTQNLAKKFMEAWNKFVKSK